MWTDIKAEDENDIARVAEFQQKNDIRYSGFTENDLTEWLERPNTSLMIFDNGNYQLGFSVYYSEDKDRYYITEMGASPNVSNEDAFKEITTQVIFFLQTRHTNIIYASIPINPKITSVGLYAEVFNDPRLKVDVLVDNPAFQHIKVTILANPAQNASP